MTIEWDIIHVLQTRRFNLHDEIELQKEMRDAMAAFSPVQSYPLDKTSLIDFFIDGIGIEVKIKGSRKKIYDQCKRYCRFQQINSLILVTNRSMGFPPEINGKPCYIVHLGKSWL